MRTLEKMRNRSLPLERFSRRTKDGVEILEHESHQVIKVKGDRYETVSDEKIEQPRSAPRLVISEAPAAAKLFISKTRSDITGLNAFLRSLTHPPLKAK
jgi:hypothetical protein